jgi:hypothetical protein
MYLSAATTCSTAPRLIAEKSKAASIWAHSPLPNPVIEVVAARYVN